GVVARAKHSLVQPWCRDTLYNTLCQRPRTTRAGAWSIAHPSMVHRSGTDVCGDAPCPHQGAPCDVSWLVRASPRDMGKHRARLWPNYRLIHMVRVHSMGIY
ncbi:hypothetical protein AMTR_s00033p00180910, partial [Amborella trichopoda]